MSKEERAFYFTTISLLYGAYVLFNGINQTEEKQIEREETSKSSLVIGLIALGAGVTLFSLVGVGAPAVLFGSTLLAAATEAAMGITAIAGILVATGMLVDYAMSQPEQGERTR